MGKPSIAKLQKQLTQASDAKTKAWFEAYMKHVLPYRGLKLPEVRTIVHAWVKAEGFGNLPAEQQLEVAIDLLHEPWAEDKLAGILIIQEILIKQRMIDWERDLSTFAALFDQGYIQEWNTCDWFCVKVLNPLVKQQGQEFAQVLVDWCEAENLWRRRASVVSFVNIARHGDRNFPGFTQLMLDTAAIVVQSSERFAQTGVGWMLRELGQADQEKVVEFVKDRIGLFSSEGLRYTIEKMPPDLQADLKECRGLALKRN
jgi:3-methyladenine DNA glycosylase AlkD